MAVFAGGFTLETAEAVCGFDIDTESGVLDALGILLENHLVERVRVVDGDETPRFDMLETIRGYAQEQLTRSGEAPALRRRHAEAYVTLGEESEPELTGPRQGVWLRRLEAEAHNIRAALAWSLEANEPELGLRLAGAVWLVWHKHSHWGQDGSWLDQLLDRGDHVSSVVRAKALNGAGSMAADRGDLARAIACFDEGLSLGHQLRDERTQAVALGKLGALACLRGDYARARSLQRESLTLSRSIEDRPGIARALLDLATVTVFEGDPEAAIPLYEESLKLLRRLGDPWKLAMALQNLASALRPRRAHARMRELLEEAIELYRSVDATGGVASARLTLGAIALDDGDPVAAASLFKEAVQEFHQEGDIPELAYGIDYLGQAAAATGDPVRAARLMGAVEALRAAAGLRCGASYRASRDRVLASVRAQLGDQRFQAAITQGASLPLDGAVREALAVNVPLPGAGDRNSRAAPASFSPPC
jgi:tetratricopeptide (TPR) repeat protein